MIDVSRKRRTVRKAAASCEIIFSKRSFDALVEGCSPKGDVFETAKIAGIMGAKNTPSLIPMCHPLPIEKVNIIFKVNAEHCSVKIMSDVVCAAKTGVEMEALTAVSIAALTVYDMMKWSDKGIVISDIKLISKSGGKSKDYVRKDK